MSIIEKDPKKYVEPTFTKINVDFVFQKFNTEPEKFKEHLDMLLRWEEIIPQGSIFYRARAIERSFRDLDFDEDEKGNDLLFGFAPNKMLAPPKEKATPGRANKTEESVLYLANKPEVCCAEIRPILTEIISVFRFTTKKNIRVMNLNSCDVQGASLLEKAVLEKVMFAFMAPVKNRKDNDYSLTQRITEHYKGKGFDGIKYCTLNSNDPDSFNLVIFDESYVTWSEEQRSEVYRVIAKSMTFQNLTDKQGITEVNSGHQKKLEVEKVDEIIRKLKREKTKKSSNDT